LDSGSLNFSLRGEGGDDAADENLPAKGRGAASAAEEDESVAPVANAAGYEASSARWSYRHSGMRELKRCCSATDQHDQYRSQQPSGRGQASLNEDLNRFLNLLITQLQNQDPLDPMDSSEFTSQLSSSRASNSRSTPTPTSRSW